MGGSGTCCHPISLTKGENFITAAKGLGDLLLRIPTPDGVGDRLGEIKVMSAGVSCYPAGRTEKQADRRARELPGSYRLPLERLDQLVRGTAPGETGALVARLQETCCVSWQGPGATTAKISTN